MRGALLCVVAWLAGLTALAALLPLKPVFSEKTGFSSPHPCHLWQSVPCSRPGEIGASFYGSVALPANPATDARRYTTKVTAVDTTSLTETVEGPNIHVNPSSRESWPQFHRDSAHRGESRDPVVLPAELAWSASASKFIQSLGVVANGGLYVTGAGSGSEGSCGEITKLGVRTGTRLWRLVCRGRFEAGAYAFDPAVDSGILYFLDRAGRALAYADEGDHFRQAWQFNFADTVRSGLVLAGDALYFGTDRRVYNLNKRTGALRWQSNLAGQSTPAADESSVYTIVDANPAALVALDVATGQERWRQPLSAAASLASSPTLASDLVLIGDAAGFHAFDAATGQPRWHFATTQQVSTTAAVTGKQVLFATSDRKLFALDLNTGAELWRAETGSQGEQFSSPIVVGDYVFIGTEAGTLRAFEVETGRLAWESAPIDGSPVRTTPVYANGLLFIGTVNGTINAFRLNGPATATPTPTPTPEPTLTPSPTATATATVTSPPTPTATPLPQPSRHIVYMPYLARR